MSTGGTEVASAFVRFYAKDAELHRAFARAKANLRTFQAEARTAGGSMRFGTALTGVKALTSGVSVLRTELRKARTEAERLGKALGGTGIRGSSRASMVRAYGGATGSVLRGLGAGLGSVTKGFGAGLSMAIRSTSSPIRGMGSMMNQSARGFGSALNQSARAFETSMRGAMAPIRAVGGFGRLGSLAGIGAGIGAAGVVAGSARAAMREESAMATLARLTGERGPGLERLGGGLRGIAGRSTSASLADVHDIAAMGARMGLTGRALERFTRDLTEVTAALAGSGTDISSFAEQTARILYIFGKGAESTRAFGSALLKLDNVSVASAGDILDVSQRLAPMARFLRMTPAQTLALSAAARQGGASPEVAGTALTQILAKMASTSGRKEFSKLAGMKTGAFERLVEADSISALQRTAQGVAGMGPLQAIEALEKLGLEGVRVRSTFLALAATNDTVRRFTELANREIEHQAEVTSAVGLQAGTTAGALTLLRNNVTLAAGSLGRGLLPIIKGTSEGLRRLAEQAQQFAERNGPAMEAWGKRAGDALSTLGTAIRQAPTWWELIRVTASEKFDQTLEVIRRFGLVAAKLMGQIGKRIGLEIENSLRDVVTNIVKAGGGKLFAMAGIPDDAVNKFIFQRRNPQTAPIDVKEAMKAAGPGGIFGNLPNRDKQQAKLWDKIREDRDAQRRAERARPVFESIVGRLAGLAGVGATAGADDGSGLDSASGPAPRRSARQEIAERGLMRSRALRAARWGGLGKEPAPLPAFVGPPRPQAPGIAAMIADQAGRSFGPSPDLHARQRAVIGARTGARAGAPTGGGSPLAGAVLGGMAGGAPGMIGGLMAGVGGLLAGAVGPQQQQQQPTYAQRVVAQNQARRASINRSVWGQKAAFNAMVRGGDPMGDVVRRANEKTAQAKAARKDIPDVWEILKEIRDKLPGKFEEGVKKFLGVLA